MRSATADIPRCTGWIPTSSSSSSVTLDAVCRESPAGLVKPAGFPMGTVAVGIAIVGVGVDPAVAGGEAGRVGGTAAAAGAPPTAGRFNGTVEAGADPGTSGREGGTVAGRPKGTVAVGTAGRKVRGADGGTG